MPAPVCWETPPPIPLTSPSPSFFSPVFPCGPGSREWEYFGGKCYYFSLTRTSWHKAKAQCEEMHSQLAVINSYAKQVKTQLQAGIAGILPLPCPSWFPGLAGQRWCCHRPQQPAESRQSLRCLHPGLRLGVLGMLRPSPGTYPVYPVHGVDTRLSRKSTAKGRAEPLQLLSESFHRILPWNSPGCKPEEPFPGAFPS